ncbi:MAG: PKD domain-containing protein [Vicinamibacterales bacterium]
MATTATFSAAGTYVLRLTASDSVLSAFAEVTVVVTTGTTPGNKAPRVDLVPARSVVLPATLSFSPGVVDDGLPQGVPLTVQWTQISGPGTVTFSPTTQARTTASFSAPGVYVLRLTASDGELSAFAEQTVTATGTAANRAPTVTAGANQTVTLPAAANLAGTVTDDGLPAGAAVTSQWMRSGAGRVRRPSPARPPRRRRPCSARRARTCCASQRATRR